MRLGTDFPESGFYLRWIISTMNIWRMFGSIVVRLINAGNLLNISSIRRNVKDVRSVPVFVRCMRLQVDGRFLILSIRKLVSVAVPVWEKCKFGAIYVH